MASVLKSDLVMTAFQSGPTVHLIGNPAVVFDECHCFAAMQELVYTECHWSLQIGLRVGIENRTLVDFDREQVGCFVPGHRILVIPTKVLSKKNDARPGGRTCF